MTDLTRTQRLSVMSLSALAITGGLVLLAVVLQRGGDPARQWVFPVLLSAFFLGGPYSWALTTLFCFPLVLLAVRNGISPLAWTAAVVLALISKAIWPEPLWNVIAYWSLPAICLAVLLGDALATCAVSSRRPASASP